MSRKNFTYNVPERQPENGKAIELYGARFQGHSGSEITHFGVLISSERGKGFVDVHRYQRTLRPTPHEARNLRISLQSHTEADGAEEIVVYCNGRLDKLNNLDTDFKTKGMHIPNESALLRGIYSTEVYRLKGMLEECRAEHEPYIRLVNYPVLITPKPKPKSKTEIQKEQEQSRVMRIIALSRKLQNLRT